MADAPAAFIDAMLQDGATLKVHDPEAMANVKEQYGTKVTYCDRPYDALEGADGLVIVSKVTAASRRSTPKSANSKAGSVSQIVTMTVVFLEAQSNARHLGG